MAASDGVLHLSTGITTVCTTSGDPAGRQVLLLHGWLESRRSFTRFTGHLPAGVRTAALDLRGHGDADRPADGYDLPTLAADVVAAMDALGMPAAVLVGASSGGYVAQQVAVDAPGRVGGLVLAGAPVDLRQEPPFAREVERLLDPIDPAWVRALLLGMVRGKGMPPWFVDQAVDDALRLPSDLWRTTVAALRTSRPPTTTGTVAAPTLVVSGGADGLVSREQTAALVAAIPGARWVEYLDAGHVVLWDEPARLAADVAAFLRGLA